MQSSAGAAASSSSPPSRSSPDGCYPTPPPSGAYLQNSHEPCFRIAWVARITTGESEEPSPLVLIQTKWDRGGLNSDPKDKDSCRESEVLLSLPALKESVYRRRDGVFVPLQKSRDRSTPRLPIPSELCLRATQRSNFNTTPEWHMNTHLTHHHDHAVITLDGDVDWPNCRSLLHSIGAAVDYYGYQLVEIQVGSPGGNGRPLRQLLDALDSYRAKGVRFRTCVPSHASSAGAILVALGDDRVAAPGARLLFHGSRVYRRGQLGARECDDLRAALLRSDDEVIQRLVERAFSRPDTVPVHGAESSDRDVLEGMCIGAPPDPENTAPARVHTLAIALGSTVDEAITGNDRESMAGLFRRLFEIDKPISGPLAKTLRLVDRVGDLTAGTAAGPDSFSSAVPDEIPFASPAGDIARETLLRHVLVVGGDAGRRRDFVWLRS